MARIKTVAYIGWRGNIDFEPIDLDNHFTGLVGVSGAGKSTLGLALAYALLPDRTYLDIKPITTLNDSTQSSAEQLSTRVDELYGYAYVILDIESRDKSRLIAGICVRPKDNSSEILKWAITGVPEDYPLQELFRVVDGEEQSYPDVSILKKLISAKGFDFHQYQTVGEYCKTLHMAGVLPTSMESKDDRFLYGKLLETSFHGGVSEEVSKRLKSYVMPEAARVSRSVSELRECVNQALQTKRSLNDANTQLDTIKGICNLGRNIVLTAFTTIKNKRRLFVQEAYDLRNKRCNKNKEIIRSEKELAERENQLSLTHETKKNATKAKYTEKEELTIEINDVETQKKSHQEVSKEKLAVLTKLKLGATNWENNAIGFEDLSWQEAVEETKRQSEEHTKEVYRLDQDILELQEKVKLLSESSNNTKTDALVQALNTTSLADTLETSSIEEATALEMMFHGLTDGAIGVTPAELASLEATKDLPEIFWIGKNTPEYDDIQSIGDWHLMPSAGGYSVMSKYHPLTFGKQARLARKDQHNESIKTLSEERSKQRALKGTLDDRHDKLHEHKESIKFYFENKQYEEQWQSELNESRVAIKNCDALIKKLIPRQSELEDEIENLESEYEAQILKLSSDVSKLNREIAASNIKLDSLNDKFKTVRSNSKDIAKKSRTCSNVIDQNVYLLSGVVDYSDLALTETEYLKQQTKSITELSKSLEEDESIDCSFISTVDSSNPEHCVNIWPNLMKIMRERMPAELLERDFDDLIKEMEQRRSQLRERVALHEGQVKVQAGAISGSINQEINSHSRKISNLSSLGNDVKFGNATGVRIKVTKKENMVGLLERMADQTSLFDSDDRPIETIMHDYFEAALATKLDGVDLLDYRAYVDLGIEVKRQGGDWKWAASLSGGESIGCGLAFVLMLFRSLVARSDYKPSEITPIFVLDELNRIDPEGQKLIAEFCAKEGIQLIITAPQMEPSHEFKLYAIARNYNGHEQMVVRELRGFHH